MSVLRDPAGNELHLVMLQVWTSDERGPILLKNRLDDENISLVDKAKNKFLMVWTAKEDAVGITELDPLITAAREAKEQAEAARAEIAQIQRDIAAVTAENKRLTAENEQKTQSLRELQKERDPGRIDRMIVEAVDKQTKLLQLEVASLKSTLADRDSDIAELKAAKKKLKEANDRLKEKR